ncbi:MAG TPA: phosphoribosylaminoimidazolesuccinocarboxamide synthase [Candidatus Saccharimonadales bacterium]|nr:phosphoribosylaminoimidazolesuccinocarboxamide synthase [Candidatus Saccharimonadales bacterium]
MSDATITTTDYYFPGQTGLYHGKVRDVYTIRDHFLVSVATDRIAAFATVLPRAIPYKGQVLNQLAAHFLHATNDIVPNWLLEVPDPNASIGSKAEPFHLEMVIRGSLIGVAWRAYQTGARTLCGVTMPDNMDEYDCFPEPILTPKIKVDNGHDKNISEAEILEMGLATESQWEQLCAYTRQLFARGQEMATARGLVLADTKYEFGITDGRIILIDEIHTPDSSRYFYKDSYEAYIGGDKRTKPVHLSKEFVHAWLVDNGYNGQPDQTLPDLPDEFVASVTQRYIELYEILTGTSFVPADYGNAVERIEENVTAALDQF